MAGHDAVFIGPDFPMILNVLLYSLFIILIFFSEKFLWEKTT